MTSHKRPGLDLSAEQAAATGTVAELIDWADAAYHVDLTDHDIVLNLAAIAVHEGAWRNNSEIEEIHAGAYKRPGQKEPRGLSDAEMMIGNIETTKLFRTHLATGSYWWYDVEDALFDFDRPYAGTPLTDHVTKKVLHQHRKQVQRNLWLYTRAEQTVGWDRFLLGTALCGLTHTHWGSPLWETQVDAWAAQADPHPPAELIDGLKTDPSLLHPDDIATALRSGLGFAPGREHWHEQHCGNPNHRLVDDGHVAVFLGMAASFLGIPQTWLYAVTDPHRDR